MMISPLKLLSRFIVQALDGPRRNRLDRSTCPFVRVLRGALAIPFFTRRGGRSWRYSR